MRSTLIAATLTAMLGFSASASAANWTGTGEVGLAFARGNSESETLNARFNVKHDGDP